MSEEQIRVLMVEDSEVDAELLLHELTRRELRPSHTRVDSEDEVRAALAGGTWDVVICDWVMPQLSAPRAIALLREAAYDGPIIVVSGTMGEEHVVEAMRAGAHDYVVKDHLHRLVPAIRREMRETEVRRSARRAEAALAESEARYRSLVETIPAATYVDVPSEDPATGHVSIFVSPQIEAMTGYAPQEFLSDPTLWARIIHPDDRERSLEADERHFRTGTPISEEYRIVARDGREVWLIDRAAMVGEGARRYSQGILADITDAKRAEEQIRTNLELLVESDRRRRELLSRLVSAQEEERTRIAGELHDDPIQQLFAAVLRLGMVSENLADADTRQALEAVRTIVEGVISRLRRMLFELEPVSLQTEGLGAALADYVELASQEGEPAFTLEDHLTVRLSREIGAIAYRVSLEALTNARKHAGATRITVRLEDDDDGVHAVVADDGAGFQLDAGGRSPPGHMGLSAMRERLELAGGRLEIRSAPGEGTTVEFWLRAA